MARIKTNKESSVKNWEQADELIAKIGEFQRRITNIETDTNEQIDMLKKSMAAEVNSMNAEIKNMTNELDLFATLNRGDFGDQKTKRLNFGQLGWRKSGKIMTAKNAVELIKEVFGKNAKTYLIIKEKVVKEKLKSLTDQQLTKIGCKRVVKDTFFVEPETVDASDEI